MYTEPPDPVPHNVRALVEVMEAAAEAGARCQLSHLIFVGRRTWPTALEALAAVESYRARGLDAAFDAFPYTAGNTTAAVLFPPEMLPRLESILEDPQALDGIRALGRRVFDEIGFYLEDIQIMRANAPRFEPYEGLFVGEAAERAGMDVWEFYARLVVESRRTARVLTGGLRDLPRVLSTYVEAGLFSFEKAVRRMTGAAAERLGLRDRGVVRPGSAADLVVLDRARLRDRASFEHPNEPPEGIEEVFLGGRHVVRGGRHRPRPRARRGLVPEPVGPHARARVRIRPRARGLGPFDAASGLARLEFRFDATFADLGYVPLDAARRFEGTIEPKILAQVPRQTGVHIDPEGPLRFTPKLTPALPLRPAVALPPPGSGTVPGGLFPSSPDTRRRVGAFDPHDQNLHERELGYNHGSGQDEYELKELYLDLDPLDGSPFVRAGKRTIVRGKTKRFRDQDQWNPQDLALRSLPSLEESRLVLFAVRAIWSLYTVGPLEDVRLELAAVPDDFEPADLGRCGEPYAVFLVCAKSAGLLGHGILGIGIAGE